MSRVYRVTVRGSVNRVVHVEDGVCTSLELLPILPQAQTEEILAAELVSRGYVRDGGVVRRTTDDGVVVEVELATGAVSVKAEATANINIQTERSERIVEERMEAGRKAAQENVERQAEREAVAAEEKARTEVAARLEKKLADLRRELDSVTSRVTAEALKQKARQIGEIEEMSEDTETGELTIKVRL